VAFSPDSRLLAVGDIDGVVQVWDLQSGAQAFLTGGEVMRRVSHMEDGTRIVLEDAAGAHHVVDLRTGAEIGPPWTPPPRQSHTSADPSGRFISGAFGPNGVLIWDAFTHEVIHQIPANAHPAAQHVRAVVFKNDGNEFLTMMANGLLQRWSSADGRPLGEMMNRGEHTVKVHWSADGQWLAANGVNSVTVWDAKTSAMLGTIRVGPGELLMDVRLSPDSEKLLLAFGNPATAPAAAHIYELPSLRPVAAPLRHADGVASAVFSSTGELVATAGEDHVVRIWRVRDGQPIAGALRHNGAIGSLLFSRDERVLATGCADGMIRLWDVARGEVIAPPVQVGGQARLICFTPDDTRTVATVGNDARQIIWSLTLVPKAVPLERLQILAECRTGVRADLSQGAMPLSAAELAAKFLMLPADDTVLPSAEKMLNWHAEMAVVAERRGAWFTAAFHLQRLTRANSEDDRLKERLQNALERSHAARP
jgi:WD40 repeat protein